MDHRAERARKRHRPQAVQYLEDDSDEEELELGEASLKSIGAHNSAHIFVQPITTVCKF